MKFGFVRTAAATTDVKVADCIYNSEKIAQGIKTAYAKKAEAVVFAELCITGYTCGDLFLQSALIDSAMAGLEYIMKETRGLDIISIVGLPVEYEGKLYNCGAVLKDGRILGIVPKTYIPNYNEFYEKRHFEAAFDGVKRIRLFGEEIPFGTKLIFCDKNKKNFTFGVEICEDLWAAVPPSSYHSLAGAAIIFNPSAGNE